MVLRRAASRRFDRPCALLQTWYADRSSVAATGGAGVAVSGVSLVDCSTIHFASWLGSRGRFPLPIVTKPSCHRWDAKERLWIFRWWLNLDRIMDGTMRNLRCQFIQSDEIWCYVGKKDKRIRKDDSPEMGSQWVFVAMDADTKLVPVYTVAKRNEETTWYFVNELAERISTRIQLTTDGYVFYNRHVEDAFGAEVDFAQLRKLYGQYGQHDTDAKYSPSPIVEVISKVRSGDPDPERICTSHVERQNLTMRMQMRRFTRLTNAFSKKLRHLKAACALHFVHYNFCRVHQSLRVTPAMAAGIFGLCRY
jgi:IS1 family transposase